MAHTGHVLACCSVEVSAFEPSTTKFQKRECATLANAVPVASRDARRAVGHKLTQDGGRASWDESQPGHKNESTGRGDYGDFDSSFPEAPIRTIHVPGITEHGTGLVWTNPHAYSHLRTTYSQ